MKTQTPVLAAGGICLL